PGAKTMGERGQTVATFRLAEHEIESGVERRGQRRRRRGGENEGTTSLDEELDRPSRPRDERAAHTERLTGGVGGPAHRASPARGAATSPPPRPPRAPPACASSTTGDGWAVRQSAA